jgi:hypothetical protein
MRFSSSGSIRLEGKAEDKMKEDLYGLVEKSESFSRVTPSGKPEGNSISS